MGEVISINISEKRGTNKYPISSVKIIENWGLEGDAHAGDWDRQVSIFPIEAFSKVPAEKMNEVINDGKSENITISGIPLEELAVNKILKIGTAEIIILHIGKDVFKENGRPYIVSREGRYGQVLKGGEIKTGDKITVL